MHLDACIAHALEKRSVYIPAAHIIVDNAHLYPTLRLGNQRIGHQVAQGIVAEDVCVEMDVAARLGYLLQKSLEEVVAVGEDVHLVVLKGQCPVLACKEFDECLMVLGQQEVFLLSKLQHRPLGELVEALLRDEPLLARVLSEEEIEHDAHHGQKYQHQHPCHGLGRLPMIHEHRDHCDNNGEDISG